jgi:anti-sigma B factor antagonist
MSDSERFAITAAWTGGNVVLTASGELDLAAAAAWDASVSETLGQMPTGITVDLGATTFVDSSGLRLILLLTQEANARGVSCTVVNISPSVARLLEITGMTDLVGPSTSD